MAVLQKRIELNREREWGHLDILCSLPTEEYNEKRGAMLVIPGGGYGMTSEREAEPIARKFYAAGYNTLHSIIRPPNIRKTPKTSPTKKAVTPNRSSKPRRQSRTFAATPKRITSTPKKSL